MPLWYCLHFIDIMLVVHNHVTLVNMEFNFEPLPREVADLSVYVSNKESVLFNAMDNALPYLSFKH